MKGFRNNEVKIHFEGGKGGGILSEEDDALQHK